jgi:hypothetical protein
MNNQNLTTYLGVLFQAKSQTKQRRGQAVSFLSDQSFAGANFWNALQKGLTL